MNLPLQDTLLQRYRADGYVAPVRMLEPRDAARYRALLEELVQRREREPALADLMYYKSHLAWAWFAELCRHPGVLDAVEKLLGPNLLLWNSCYLPKAPQSKSWFTWHQDATYWGLEPPRVATVWLALSDATAENGCLRVIPGSHLGGQLSHENTFDPDVMLPRGQRVTAPLDESRAIDLPLAPGEASIHDVFTVHGSGPNRTDAWRLGCNFTFVGTDVRPLNGPESAILVRGTDSHHHFHPETWPDGDLTAAALAEHAAAMARMGTRRSEPGTPAAAMR